MKLLKLSQGKLLAGRLCAPGFWLQTLTQLWNRRLIRFGFNCHEPDLNAGMSVPLLSVDLATLMAIFRSEDLSKEILVENLTVLIKDSAKALLDPRLANGVPGSSLDEATSTQMVRAINKLAVQAATGATRHYSFESLISLQQQLCLKADEKDDPVFNSRISRVVSKLFARVVKAEEATTHPFSSAAVDIEAVMCFLEDTLVACDEAVEQKVDKDSIATTRNMAKSLVEAILKARGEGDSFLAEMEDLEIDPTTSALGHLVSMCADELGFSKAAGLVSDASPIQLDDSDDEDNDKNAGSVPPSSMTERIRNLRVRLNATEAVVQSAVERVSPSGVEVSVLPPVAEKAPTTARGFRDRLAAAQEKRVASSVREPQTSPRPTESAGSRAAALRARLQAVKRQSEKNEF